jgi:hypothetical protein
MKANRKKTRKQVGAHIDTRKWARLRAEAMIQGRPCGYLVDDAIDLYLDKRAEDRTMK